MRIAVLVKQVPVSESLRLVDGRLERDGVAVEVNAFCRRANALAVALRGAGEVVVFTMGPPSADDALREMVACGADRGVHLCDPAFAGSDTLATARALALAVNAEGPFDLVLCGQSSLDADTGQVGPQVAALLSLPFAGPARELRLDGRALSIRAETDAGHRDVELSLPALVSAAERLCDPSKAPRDLRAAVDPGSIRRVTAAQLGLRPHEAGAAGSPTTVGEPRTLEVTRAAVQAVDAAQAVALLRDRGALTPGPGAAAKLVAESGRSDLATVWVVLADDAPEGDRNVLMAAPPLAAALGGRVVAVVSSKGPEPGELSEQGADEVLVLSGGDPAGELASLEAGLVRERPAVVLVEGTPSGRVAAATVAARRGWGLIADAIEVAIAPDGRLEAWKSAFGGRLVAPVRSASDVQLCTVRPGALPARTRRSSRSVPVRSLAPGAQRWLDLPTVVDERVLDHTASALRRAEVVLGVGQGIDPADYHRLGPLQAALGGAELAATRKVTDRGWLPRSRQVGITGLTIAPRLYVALGISGRFNHLCGVQGASTLLAVNADPSAEVFEQADVGLVGDWRVIVDDLVAALEAERSGTQA